MKTLNSIKLPLIAVCIWALTQKWFEQTFSQLLVGPIFSKVGDGQRWIVWLVLLALLAFAVWRILQRWTSGYRYSANWVGWCAVYVLVYLYYRIAGHPWQYKPLFNEWTTALKISDLLLIPVALLCVRGLLVKRRASNVTAQGNAGFLGDNPIQLRPENDRHHRGTMAKALADRIRNTPNQESAFAIAIIGKWGVGKTTFMNAVRSDFSADSFHQFSFNPWLVEDVGNITKTFFDELASELSLYDSSLRSDLSNYVGHLLDSGKKNPVFSVAYHFSKLLGFKNAGLTELKSRINDVLKSLKKRVVIYIDDLDRLDSKETAEVLRIVRNSGDFANIFFIVALDKAQVVQNLHGIFGAGSNRFLEKVFQIEFYLAPLKSRYLLEDLNDLLQTEVSEEDGRTLKRMFSRDQWGEPSYFWLHASLQHYREVIRYLNLFRLHYSFLKGEVFFPDLYVLTFLRLKYPEVYYDLYHHRHLLVGDGDDFASIHIVQPLSTRMEKDSTAVRARLQEKKASLGVTDDDIDEIESLVRHLFPSGGPNLFQREEKYRNQELRISNSHYFDRYFDLHLYGELSRIAFDKAFALPEPEFFKVLKEWHASNQIREAAEILARKNTFRNRADFERTISALIHISEMEPVDYRRIGMNHLVSEATIFSKLDFQTRWSRGASVNDPRVTLFGSRENYEQYVRSILTGQARIGSLVLGMMEGIVSGDYPNFSLPVSEEEVVKLTLSAFQQAVQSEIKVSWPLLHLYATLTSKASDDIKNEVSGLLRNFVLTKDVEGFLQHVVQTCTFHNDNFVVTDWASGLFGSDDDFMKALKPSLTDDAQAEFEQFLEQTRASKCERRCAPFNFRHLQIEKSKAVAENSTEEEEGVALS